MAKLKRGSGLARVFTEEERRQAADRDFVLAGDFAVKEAVSKCFGTGFRGISLLDIEVLRDDLGKPYVRLHGGAEAAYGRMQGTGLQVSITDTGDLAMAVAVLEGVGDDLDEMDRNRHGAADAAVSELAGAEGEEGTAQGGESDPFCSFRPFFPRRRPEANKGSYGKVLLAAGSPGMGGAAFLSALAAYRCGAGLVRILTVRENLGMLQTLLPEAIVTCYGEEDFQQGHLEEIVHTALAWADVLVLGPGLSTGRLARELLRTVLEGLLSIRGVSSGTPGSMQGQDAGGIPKSTLSPILVLDADGLNLLSMPELKAGTGSKISELGSGGKTGSEAEPKWGSGRADPECTGLLDLLDRVAERLPVIVTPHPMEMSRLCGRSLGEVLQDPAGIAEAFSRRHHVITVLKGSETLVYPAEGDGHFQNHTPSPALAKGGSGDVLAGCIAGIYEILKADRLAEMKAEGREQGGAAADPGQSSPEGGGLFLAYRAAILGVLAHAEAGRRAARQYGEHGVLARDTANELGRVLAEWK